MKKENEREVERSWQFANQIIAHMAQLFDEESGAMQLNVKNDEITEFIHALANIVPSFFHKQITGVDISLLEFNHLANRLVFQFTKMSENNKEEEGND